MFNWEEERQKFRFKMKLDVRWGDMDEMHHVNNAVYHTYTEQARIYYFHDTLKLDWGKASFILASSKMDFVKPLVFPADASIYLRCSRFGNKSFDLQCVITNTENGREWVSAVATTTLVMYHYQTNTTIVMPEEIKSIIREFELVKP